MAARKKDWKAVKDFYWPKHFNSGFINEGEAVDLPPGMEPDEEMTEFYGRSAFGYEVDEGMIIEEVGGRRIKKRNMAHKTVLLPLVRNE